MLLRLPLPLLLPLLLRLLVHGNSRAAFVCDTWLKAQASKEYSMEVSAPGIDTTGFKPTLLANAGVCVSLTLSLSLSVAGGGRWIQVNYAGTDAELRGCVNDALHWVQVHIAVPRCGAKP